MKIKYSALVSATSGKLNGSVAASNRGGAYLRNKGVTSNPQTVSQQANRSLFGSISSQFRSLTPGQIAAWNAAAQDFPVIDRFGDTRYLSGLALFVQLNKNLADVGEAQLVNPPAKQSFPATLSATAVVEATALGVLDNLDVTLNADGVVSSDFVLQVKATRPISPSVSYVKNLFRVVGISQGTGIASVNFTGTSEYTGIFGSVSPGQKIVFELSFVNVVSGEKSAPFIIEAIATLAA